MIIKFSNNKEYPVCSTGDYSTRVIPSNNPNIRSQMYVYMTMDTMTFEEFITLFADEVNLETITFKGETFENMYENYTVVQSVGKELVTEVDFTTGEVISEYRLVAKLEQLTYIEQKLKELGL